MLADAFLDAETSLGLQKSAAGHLARGACYDERREFQKAIIDFEAALALEPNNQGIKQRIEAVKKKLGQPNH